jgi:hypothetical protein
MEVVTMSHPAELIEFVHFAMNHLESGKPALSPEALIEQWRADQELVATAAEMRVGLEQLEQGRGQPVAEAFADVRRRFDLT